MADYKSRYDELKSERDLLEQNLRAAKEKQASLTVGYGSNSKANKAAKAAEKALKDWESTNAEEFGTVKGAFNLDKNLGMASDMAPGLLGSAADMGRIRDDQAVIDARQAYSDATNMDLRRDASLRNLQAQEASQSRQLAGQLARSGVKGGLAGGAYTDLASMNLRNRAGMEQDLMLANQAAVKDFADFETSLARLDLDAERAEKVAEMQAKTGIAGYLGQEGSAARQEYLNSLISTSGGGKS